MSGILRTTIIPDLLKSFMLSKVSRIIGGASESAELSNDKDDFEFEERTLRSDADTVIGRFLGARTFLRLVAGVGSMNRLSGASKSFQFTLAFVTMMLAVINLLCSANLYSLWMSAAVLVKRTDMFWGSTT